MCRLCLVLSSSFIFRVDDIESFNVVESGIGGCY